MSERNSKIKIHNKEYLEGEDVSFETDRSVIFKIYKLLKSDLSTIKGFVIFVTLISLASMIMVIVLLQKISEYGC